MSSNNACNNIVQTMDCNPGNKNLWFKYKLPEDVDPVRSNIVNGCWECNYEESNRVNTILCNRAMYDGYIPNPNCMARDVDINSKLKNIDKPIHKYCILK